MSWHGVGQIESRKYRCGHCDSIVASREGYSGKFGDEMQKTHPEKIYVCTHCQKPTHFVFSREDEVQSQNPANSFGDNVENLPDEIKYLYEEARRCTGSSSYTAAVMLCRKLLMHIAVEKGAGENLKFVEYVKYLDQERLLPLGSKNWVDIILKQGNEANHEIALKKEADAKQLVEFMEMLLKLIYEFPDRVHKLESKNDEQNT